MGKSKCSCVMKMLGRILYGGVMIVFGAMHFMNAADMAEKYLSSSSLPFSGTFWVYLTGLVLVLAGIAILAKKYVSQLGTALAVMLILFVLMIHLQADPVNMGAVLKDLALAGSALFIAGVCCAEKCSTESCSTESDSCCS